MVSFNVEFGAAKPKIVKRYAVNEKSLCVLFDSVVKDSQVARLIAKDFKDANVQPGNVVPLMIATNKKDFANPVTSVQFYLGYPNVLTMDDLVKKYFYETHETHPENHF